jgi:lysyl-tRNA synthetase class II
MKPKLIKIICFIVCVFFISCDLNHFILFVNKSGKKIFVTVYYNKKYFDYFFEKHKNIDFINSIQSYNSKLNLIKSDTINSNLALSYYLKTNDTLYVDSSRSINLGFESIDSITVKYEDNLHFVRKRSYIDSFSESKENLKIFEIR